MKSKLKIWELSALFALCAALCAGTWAQGRQEAISSSLLRLHVLAVSDEQSEQEIKLRVRDAVLEYLSPKLAGAESAEEAKRIVGESLPGLTAAAKSAAEGRAVKLRLCRESYPLREYGDFTLPAGEYDSLQVILGEGLGHNWWCVVFPPLCLSVCEGESAQTVMDSVDPSLVTEAEGYELRFRTLELWGELTQWLQKKD